MDIIRRGAKLVDRLIIGVTTNPSKYPMFTLDERMAMVRTRSRSGSASAMSRSKGFDALLMEFAEREGRKRASSAGCAPSPISNMNIRWRA